MKTEITYEQHLQNTLLRAILVINTTVILSCQPRKEIISIPCRTKSICQPLQFVVWLLILLFSKANSFPLFANSLNLSKLSSICKRINVEGYTQTSIFHLNLEQFLRGSRVLNENTSNCLLEVAEHSTYTVFGLVW